MKCSYVEKVLLYSVKASIKDTVSWNTSCNPDFLVCISPFAALDVFFGILYVKTCKTLLGVANSKFETSQGGETNTKISLFAKQIRAQRKCLPKKFTSARGMRLITRAEGGSSANV